MRMQPDSRELVRPASQVDLSVEEIRHGIIRERNGYRAGGLFDQCQVSHVEQVVFVGYAKGTDLGRAQITQVEQFGPGRGAEP